MKKQKQSEEPRALPSQAALRRALAGAGLRYSGAGAGFKPGRKTEKTNY